MVTMRLGSYFANRFMAVATCSANSLVGVSTSPWMPLPSSVLFSNPTPNARVLPDPVAEAAMTSFPASIGGMVFVCTSLGSSILSSFRAFVSLSPTPNDEKDIVIVVTSKRRYCLSI